MYQSEAYWNRRALEEMKAALKSDDAHVAAVHVDLATRCVRNAVMERDQGSAEAAAAAPAVTN